MNRRSLRIRAILDLDSKVSTRMRIAETPGVLRTLARFFAHSGDSWLWGAGLLLVWFGKDAFWGPLAFMLGVSVFITAVLVLLIKFTIRRRRPEGEWGEIYRSTDPHSFPSGHAARSFMLAVMSIGLAPPWFATLLVVWAPLVALARVAMGVHYLSDVIAGALLGILIGWIGFRTLPMLMASLSALF
jgi:undecaprenyl-diphosphatase